MLTNRKGINCVGDGNTKPRLYRKKNNRHLTNCVVNGSTVSIVTIINELCFFDGTIVSMFNNRQLTYCVSSMCTVLMSDDR